MKNPLKPQYPAIKKYIILSAFFILCGMRLQAQKEIHIHNTTSKSIHVALYYVFNDHAQHFGNSFAIPANKIKQWHLTNRTETLFYSCALSKKEDLPEKVDHKELLTKCVIDITSEVNKKNEILHLYIHENSSKKLEILSSDVWHKQMSLEQMKTKIRTQSIYASNIAFAREADSLCIEECTFIKNRLKHVQGKYEQLFDKQNKNPPRIALCASGGGFRSMLATTGFLHGAEQSGLLDLFLYSATLSGSSWAKIAWIINQTSISEFKKQLTKRFHNGIITFDQYFYEKFELYQQRKSAFDQESGIVDLYGMFLANTLFSKKSLEATLSDMHNYIQPEKHPFPLLTAVSNTKDGTYDWLEFSPYEVRSTSHNIAIPTWAFGRKFENGLSKEFVPEPTLGYLMGILGSAFCLNVKTSIMRAMSYLPYVKNLISSQNSFFDETWTQKHIFAADFHNFAYNFSDTSETTQEKLQVVDAGYCCNIPLEVLIKSQRKLDIIIILDSRREAIPEAKVLKDAQRVAEQNGYKLPPIDIEKACTQSISIFEDSNNQNCPTLIYIPLRHDQEFGDFNPATSLYCHSVNFWYSEEQAEQVADFGEFLAKKHSPTIFDFIRLKFF